ncbi:gpCom control of modification [Bacillus phage BCPST]|uniref:Com family DNA-binding transcriptional regulator n=1 Tax=Bacillus phage BCPST TaxID=2801506 RepID=A0AAE7TQL2_9CAUD|nr:gpCom control of modification [Bacillus phage BCPST]QQO38624.1 hypothetical protein BCPST_006 [Bacillus phage BCPST]QSJ04214.1 hypothetical protein BCP6_009 [Bacillus phage BCP6]
MKEYRCKTCRKLLFKGFMIKGSISIKCNKCKLTNEIEANEKECSTSGK